MPLPTFVVIGAAKSGTTALYKYLGQHPDVHLTPREEPSFFAFTGEPPRFRGPGGTDAAVNTMTVSSREEYERLFADARPDQARGDVSPVYLYWPGTAERLAAAVPDVRVIAVLRHPVDRAYSAFMHARREAKEPLADFRAALRAEPGRIAEGYGFLWRYQDMGRYARQLQRFLDVFPREQLFVALYDDLAADPVHMCRRVQGFIGVDTAFTPDTSVRHNVSGIPRSRTAYRLMSSGSPVATAARRVGPLVGVDRLKAVQARMRTRLLRRQGLDRAVRAELVDSWGEEIRLLAGLLDRDLGHWLSPDGEQAS
ncbi:MAG TPA: sulfotransferase [Euzebya sp.]|nr:sulfotransferase [Euzebya sp.]